jgi:hypothetical protein
MGKIVKEFRKVLDIDEDDKGPAVRLKTEGNRSHHKKAERVEESEVARLKREKL